MDVPDCQAGPGLLWAAQDGWGAGVRMLQNSFPPQLFLLGKQDQGSLFRPKH